MPKPVLAAVNGPAVGIGCSLALARDLIVARESAYFLLAFVNIGLVPDGGSSLLIPERVGLARATEMAMLGERIGARQALEWGLINRVTRRRRVRGRRRRAGGHAWRPGRRAPTPASSSQLNAWLFARMDAQLELEASIQQQRRGVRRLPGGRPGVPAEAPARVRGPMTGRFRRLRPYTADAVAASQSKTRRRLRALAAALPVAVLGALMLAPAASAGWFLPECDGSPNADGDPDAVHPDRADRPRDLHRRRGPADLLDDQVPRPQGPRRRADPRQHAARDRLDGRRRRDPDLPDRLHVRPAGRHQEPGGVRDRRRRQPGRDATRRSRRPTSRRRPRAARR